MFGRKINYSLNKMFSEELEKINWEATTEAIYAKTESDVLELWEKNIAT